MTAYKKHLARDHRLRPILRFDIEVMKPGKNLGTDLIASILAQQLSTKVAKILYQRFLQLFPGKRVSMKKMVALSVSELRSIGISHKKAEYILGAAHFFLEHKITAKKLSILSDEEIILLLTQIRGVGRWTVEMLLIFSLGREDVFALDDLGIQQAMQKLFRLNHLQGKELKQKMQKLSEPWSPYRSYVCLYLWRYKDGMKN